MSLLDNFAKKPLFTIRHNKIYSVEELFNLNLDTGTALLQSIIFHKSFYVYHPVSGVITAAFHSERAGMCNTVLFADEEGKNSWYFIQLVNFLDGYLAGTTSFSHLKDGAVDKEIERLSNGKSKLKLKNQAVVEGLLVSQSRPYHFIYDQLVNVHYLVNQNDPCRAFFKDDSSYLDSLGSIQFQQTSKRGCYLFPTINRGRYYGEPVKAFHKDLINLEAANTGSDLTLWFGVTGQKRSWFEQVTACVEIVEKTLEFYKSVTLVIDGWTAFYAAERYTKEDQNIYKDIKDALKKYHNIQLVNLIDTTYQKKFQYALATDFYIANSGTGSMVPQAIADRKGVIHGKLKTFEKLYNENVLKVPDYKVAYEDTGIPMNDSYSFHWAVVYNLLLDLGLKGNKINEVDLEDWHSPDGFVKTTSLELFKNFTLKQSFKLPDILREIALIFEKIGNVEVALGLMSTAVRMRPKGQFLVEKYSCYLEQTEGSVSNKYAKPLDDRLYSQRVNLLHQIAITSEMEVADLLKKIAIVYEKTTDLPVAQALMQKALEQRPNGGFIQQKCQEYKTLLASEQLKLSEA